MPTLDELDLLLDAAVADLRLLASDEMGGRFPDTPGNARARAHLVTTLHRLGVTPVGASYERPFSWKGEDGRFKYGTNVLGLIPGRGAAAERVMVVSAHHDHLGREGDDTDTSAPTPRDGAVFNGADDNASGVAALLAVARHLVRHPPACTVLLAFFDAEEEDFKGSLDLTERPPFPLERVALDVNLDMLGRNFHDTLWAVGTRYWPGLREPLAQVAERAPLRLRFGHDRLGWVPRLAWDWTDMSDHYAFHERDIPWVYFGVASHADTHETSDTSERLDEDFFRRATTTVLDAVLTLDGWIAGGGDPASGE